MTQENETAWLIEAQAGDYSAFDLLHTALEPSILRFVRRLVGSQQAAEDITQDVFIALFKNLDQVDPPEKLRPYLFRIARNRCYDLLRKQGRYEHVTLDDEPMQVRVSFLHQQELPPDEVTHWILLNMEVQEAMEQLPEVQRQTLILYSEEDMSYAEIADIMDVSMGTVKSRLHHAKKNLRRLIRPQTLLAIQDIVADEPEATTQTSGNTGDTKTDNPANAEDTQPNEELYEQQETL